MERTYTEQELKIMMLVENVEDIEKLPILTRKQLMKLGYSANHIQRNMKEAARLTYSKGGFRRIVKFYYRE